MGDWKRGFTTNEDYRKKIPQRHRGREKQITCTVLLQCRNILRYSSLSKIMNTSKKACSEIFKSCSRYYITLLLKYKYIAFSQDIYKRQVWCILVVYLLIYFFYLFQPFQINLVLEVAQRLGFWASLEFPSVQTFTYRYQHANCTFSKKIPLVFSQQSK